MYQKFLLSIFTLLAIPGFTFSQATKTAIVKGKVLKMTTKAGLQGILVTVQGLDAAVTTKFNGQFTISKVPYGNQKLILSGANIKNDTISFLVEDEIINLSNIYPSLIDAVDVPTITLDDNSVSADDDAISSQNTAGIYSASMDQFPFMSGYMLGRYNFNPRGLDNMEEQINGISIIDAKGYSAYGLLGGLNDVLHARNTTYGLAPSGYSYGNTNGSNCIEATAADQRQGSNVSYYNSNNYYTNRLSINHNTGILKNGWAFSAALSRRWGKEGYVPGTFYNGYSFYGSISKIVKKSQFSLTGFAAPTTRGQAVYAAIDEVYKLAGNNQYNSGWGYQNGEKRNSRVVNSNQPLIIANYIYKPTDHTKWNTALSYQFGKYKNSFIDFYNAYNPNPDYYRNLPSYYLNFSTPDSSTANAVRSQLAANPDQLQMNWDNFYNSNYMNYETIKGVNGVAGNDVTGRRSLYVVSNRVEDAKKLSFNSNIEHAHNEHLNLAGGLTASSAEYRFYKELSDLLGGDFYLNNNQFANQQAIQDPSFAQNDLNKPNQLIKVGDKYGYDYSIRLLHSMLWGQAAFTYNKLDFFAAANAKYTSYSREGYMRNGLFPNNSYGKSAANDFLTHGTKGGVTWKLDMRHNLYVNADYSTYAPLVNTTYISAQKRDFTVTNPVPVKVKTAEAGYILKSPGVYARVTGYVTDVSDIVINKLFFNDDPATVSFVNYIMRGVNTRSTGVEFSGNLKLSSDWSVNAIASTGQYFYTNRPSVSYYQDNQPGLVAVERKVYIKNYYVGSGPQKIGCLALNYSRNFWWGRVNLNYTDNNYVDINPDRRTQEAADLVAEGTQRWNEIYKQEKLPAAYTVDISAGKSYKLSKISKKLGSNSTIAISLSVLNLLNITDIKVAGYEQLRYDYVLRNPNKFPNKYDYAFGRNYHATIVLRF